MPGIAHSGNIQRKYDCGLMSCTGVMHCGGYGFTAPEGRLGVDGRGRQARRAQERGAEGIVVG